MWHIYQDQEQVITIRKRKAGCNNGVLYKLHPKNNQSMEAKAAVSIFNLYSKFYLQNAPDWTIVPYSEKNIFDRTDRTYHKSIFMALLFTSPSPLPPPPSSLPPLFVHFFFFF